jgi:predicted transglutaminase-like cysteine proteinase
MTTAILYGISPAAGLEFELATLDKVEVKYGHASRQRLVTWKRLINSHLIFSDLEKLQKVNDFFNENTAFVDDSILWNTTDYWASPIEFLLKGAGDCEDYSIAKYFTLVEMGVDENKLRINYVKALELNQAHMVLTYYESPNAEPLVLDNLVPVIKPASQRHDLLPIYSFNGTNLWLAKNSANGNPAGSSDQLSLWQNLKQRALIIPVE